MPPMTRIEVLLIDDDEADVELTKKFLLDPKINLHVCYDGAEALQFLKGEGEFAHAVRPDLILLDLNMPKKHGQQTLADIKADERFKCIPVIMLTTSRLDEDVKKSYELGCNCFILKNADIREFEKAMKVFREFWFTAVQLPPRLS
jgi:chemotaxis family two-component system response regulator Rcp1